jgi:hypothetical protein
MIKHVILVAFALGAATASAQPAPASAKQACADAMNADSKFASDIIRTALVRNAQGLDTLCADVDTAKAHLDAAYHVEKDERHVIIAYGAMWLVAAGFVIFLWRRQLGLRAEIAQLRKELEAAVSKEGA